MKPQLVSEGRVISLIETTLTGSGTRTVDFIVQANTLLLSLFVRSVAGNVTVTCATFTYPGEQTKVIEFPTISAPTTDLLLRKAAVTLANCRLTITHTANCELQVTAKGLSAGELVAKAIGVTSATAKSVNVTNSPTLVVAASLDERSGILIKNTSSDTVYVGFTTGEASVATGYPLATNDTLSIDLAAGQAIYAIKATAGTANLRIIEALT